MPTNERGLIVMRTHATRLTGEACLPPGRGIAAVALALALASCGTSDSRKLVDAIVAQNDNEAIRLLEAGVDPNRPATYREWKPGELKVVSKTIRWFNQSLTEKHEVTPLMAAASVGSLPVARVLFQKGADVDRRGSMGWRALTCAFDHRHPEMVKLLLSRGASDHMGAEGEHTTFLIKAVEDGDVRWVEQLLDAGMKVDGRDSKGRTALMIAVGDAQSMRTVEAAEAERREEEDGFPAPQQGGRSPSYGQRG